MTSQFTKTLIAHLARAEEIDKMGRVLFKHEDLPNGCSWIEPGNRPLGVTKGQSLDIYYCYVPNVKGYHFAELPKS